MNVGVQTHAWGVCVCVCVCVCGKEGWVDCGAFGRRMLDDLRGFQGPSALLGSPQEGGRCVQKGPCHPGRYEKCIFLFGLLSGT